MCKHTIKVFKMLHPDINDSATVYKASTKYRLDCTTPMLQSFINMSQHSTKSYSTTDVAKVANIIEVLKDVVPHDDLGVEHMLDAPAP